MDIWLQALFLGIIEGLTEFIPVSSTGHLIIASNAIDFSLEQSESFSIFIQLGAILAVVLIYLDRNFSGILAIIKLFLGFLPACILGVLFYSSIKEVLFKPVPVAVALIVGGIILIIAERKIDNENKLSVSLDDITNKQAFLVGCFQCFALWPGMSRSGSTIIGGMLSGLNKKTSADFSFILAVPVMCAAVSYDLLKNFSEINYADIKIFIFGFVIAFIVSYFAIKFFLQLLQKVGFWPFGVYRIILG
ncbi:UNVERIFIED_CONTAM: hypothetical protein GTU68_015508, partial [Idotea baltica]|nr:hypothetical protein [Idotea baltica]